MVLKGADRKQSLVMGPDCTTLPQKNIRFDVRGDCVYVHDALFQDIISPTQQGGVIYCMHTKINSTIVETSFVNVKAANSIAYGGAMYLNVPTVTTYRCCGNRCYSNDYGSFSVIHGEGSHQFGDTAIIFSEATNRDGTIEIQPALKPCKIAMKRMNFTLCRVRNKGSAFKIDAKNQSFTSSHLILVDLAGDTGIHSYCQGNCSLSFSNIYNNTLSRSFVAVYCDESGFPVSNCIFRNNSCDFGMNSNSPNQRFTISNCVFDRDFPPPEWVNVSSGNSELVVSESHPIFFTSTLYCPAITQSFPPTPSWSISAKFIRTKRFQASVFLPTVSFTASDQINDSCIFLRTKTLRISYDFVFPRSGENGGLIAGIVAGCVILIVIFSIVVYVRHRNRESQPDKGSKSLTSNLETFCDGRFSGQGIERTEFLDLSDH
jgi:hypothetical protein